MIERDRILIVSELDELLHVRVRRSTSGASAREVTLRLKPLLALPPTCAQRY